ncbi:MAG: ABC transporter substrate-binding protein [Bryobacterales bacterium]|nr:ABC transporter substrate-binding protein [Bryobacterales bacterium]
MMRRRDLPAMMAALLPSCLRPGTRPRVRIAVLSTSIGTLAVYLAKSLRFFEQEGLDVHLEELSSTGKTMEALLGGSVAICASTYEQTLQAAALGRDVRSFFLLYTFPNNALVVAPGRPLITTIEQLKNKTVGVTSLGSASQNYLSIILLRHGMSLADVQPVAIGTAGTSIAALENNKVDAAMLTSIPLETLRARRPGMKVLVDLRTPEGTAVVFGVPHVPVGAVVSSSRWLVENPDTARRITRALARAAGWIHERSSIEVAASLPASWHTPGSGAAQRSLELAMPALSRDGRMPQGGPEAIRDFLKLAVDPSLNVDLMKTYTNEFLEAKP